MRRKLIILALLTIGLLVTPTGSAAFIPCDQANAACEGLADADMLSCVIVYGDDITPDQFKGCVTHAAGIYKGCMEAHGCPIVN
jgi:hypothetical protein